MITTAQELQNKLNTGWRPEPTPTRAPSRRVNPATQAPMLAVRHAIMSAQIDVKTAARLWGFSQAKMRRIYNGEDIPTPLEAERLAVAMEWPVSRFVEVCASAACVDLLR